MSIPKDTENTPQYIEWREGVVLRQITNMNGDIWPIDRISVFDYYIWLYIGE
jgi:hypothetical protein